MPQFLLHALTLRSHDSRFRRAGQPGHNLRFPRPLSQPGRDKHIPHITNGRHAIDHRLRQRRRRRIRFPRRRGVKQFSTITDSVTIHQATPRLFSPRLPPGSPVQPVINVRHLSGHPPHRRPLAHVLQQHDEVINIHRDST
jgi:hypothetical protein